MNVLGKDENDQPILRPIEYRDIVVLLRSMKFKSDQYAELLRAAGVPVHSESGTGFFDSMEIRDMIALLQVLENRQRDIPLAAVLRSPIAALAQPEDSLARIRLAYPGSVSFHRAVIRYASEQADELAAKLKDILDELTRWRTLAHRRPVAELLWTIYDESGYLAFCSGLAGGEQRVANLVRLHEKARQFGSFQRQGLGRFMEFLESIEEESDLGTPSIASEADDVVRIMSVHRSKGLEFPVVFLPDLGRKHNLRDLSGPILADREGYLGLSVVDEEKRIRYPSLPHALLKDRIRRQTIAEELRVLYVATTRAREHLILVGTCKENKPDEWRQRWADHAGPLPADEIVRSSCMLDWIGPSAAAMERSDFRIEITSHSEDETASWAASVAAKNKSAMEQQLADLKPLDPPAPLDPSAAALVARLTTPYRFNGFSDLPATQSVTSLTKHGRSAPGGIAESITDLVRFDQKLPMPRCLASDARLSPTEIGSLTHAALQHLDFTRPCDANDLKQQIEQLIAKKKLATACGDSLDLAAIEWLMQSEVGKLLCKHAKALRREVPIYYPAVAEGLQASNDPMDRVMIRGQIDALIPADDGLVLIDYKTDRVTEETIDARAEFYRAQVESYGEAVRRITGQDVKATYLFFLTPRLIRKI
ncbi:MAG TPA: 3'-5' exonuclease, partial [Tepidisphaeraceae bacterium]|nr:3'-5' exonuclease [Tepidisphaeraceae bacterium]